MWSKPWGYKEGAAIGCGLLATGFLLQVFVGRIDWRLLEAPVNIIILLIFLLLLIAMHTFRKKVYLFEWLSHGTAAVSSLTFVVAITIVMGLTRQIPSQHIVSTPDTLTGFSQMLSAWHFVLLYVWMTTVLGLSILRVGLPSDRRRALFLLNHLGLFIALVTATLGNADMQYLRMSVSIDKPECRAVERGTGRLVKLPLTIELKNSESIVLPDGGPLSYSSNVIIHTPNGLSQERAIEVNKPFEIGNLKIYLVDYYATEDDRSSKCVFEIVSDPWLPIVYSGIVIMIAGAVCLFITAQQKRKRRTVYEQ